MRVELSGFEFEKGKVMLSYLLAAECAIGGKGNLEEVAGGGTTGLISSPGEDGKMYFLASDNFNDEFFQRLSVFCSIECFDVKLHNLTTTHFIYKQTKNYF